MILVELTAAIDAAGTLKTFYVADSHFATSPTDTPASIAFDPSIIDPGSIGLHAFADGRTGGATKLETGEIVLANVDGQYDAWLNYSFDGRPVVIRSGAGGAYPGAFTTLLAATVESIEATTRQVVIRLRDKQWMFQLPIRAAALYGGTNALPNGLDGVAADLKGKARPVAFGRVFNVSPPLVNTSRLIFEVSVCNSIDAVYSNGVVLTAGAAYGSQADMEANAPSAGQYRAWPAGGYFRLGSYSGEQITADLTQGATAGARTVAQIIRTLALAAGLSSGEISAPDVSALDALNSSVVGIWIDDASTTFASAMDQLAASIGAWYGFDGTGVLRMGRLSSPSGTPMLTLSDYDVLEGFERRPPRDNGTPVWSVTANHTKIWTVQTSGLAGAAAARVGFVARERRSAVAADAAVKTQWKLAGTIELDTLLTTESDAAAEAGRQLALYKARRDLFDVPVDIGVLTGTPARIGDAIALVHPRFGMSGGRTLRLIGIAYNLAANTATLSLWG
ncbi:hypothetical protein GTP38_11405 [Duganella sp. FT94W]|uniref:Tip attachment protein J domain-containing protein n=1 Tax=Duganella lactea TaxID=2692173 RepID=A0ABW9V8D3_9BURK|nr:hypothetical protein [Duganella lactea]MYM34943.1 hypothetical protein [Duganella lactea]